jgi:hypothetical protein
LRNNPILLSDAIHFGSELIREEAGIANIRRA